MTELPTIEQNDSIPTTAEEPQKFVPLEKHKKAREKVKLLEEKLTWYESEAKAREEAKLMEEKNYAALISLREKELEDARKKLAETETSMKLSERRTRARAALEKEGCQSVDDALKLLAFENIEDVNDIPNHVARFKKDRPFFFQDTKINTTRENNITAIPTQQPSQAIRYKSIEDVNRSLIEAFSNV